MLYQAIRPRTFDEIVGNVSVIKALRKIVKQKDHPHTFLFSGPTGCGKTTLARIVAREFGCKDESVVEINAANTRGVDTTRKIANEIHLSSIYGGPKAYILDESHELTKKAQDLLLKPTEDVPDHCYFFFCTTNPEHLIPTLRGRCTDFIVSTLEQDEIFELLLNTTMSLDIKVDDEVLVLISETSDGCPRKALVSLEKVKDMEDIEEIYVLLTKESVKDESIFNLYKALITLPHLRIKYYKKILRIFSNIEAEPEGTRRALLKLFLKHLTDEQEDEEFIKDMAGLIKVFSQSTFYGGKEQLGSMIVQAIFG